MSEEVAACPECDSPTIEHCGVNGYAGRRGEDRPTYHCKDCSAGFDTPTYRETRTHRNSQSGAARKLLDADPEDYPA